MRRYRIWVGALHWGQLLLLLPSLLFIGVAVGGGAYLFTDSRDNDAYYAVGEAETALREDSVRVLDEIFGKPLPEEERRRLLAAGFTEEEILAYEDRKIHAEQNSFDPNLVRPLDTNLVRAVENAQAEKERVKSVGTWVLGVGMFGWAFAWLTAFLSLWWWFGARAKPRENR